MITGKAAVKLQALAAAIMIFIAALMPVSVYAAEWPTAELRAEAAILVDADTGVVLFQKNPHEREYPASITKVLTALVVLKHCDPAEQVTFSHDDVYNVDPGSSNAQIDQGDVLSVEDCLYALLLKSANEAANALACHVSGSREAFAELMNQEAAALGCVDSHFTNPSGLHNEEHYTSAYDMALIGIAAMSDPEFMKIEANLSHRLAPTKRVPAGNVVYMEHKMLRKDTQYTDKRVIAGKTGYTTVAGNTLITMAEDQGRRVVAVVLKDKNPQHYTDTKTMLDMGFGQTVNELLPADTFDMEEICSRMKRDTVVPDGCQPEDLRLIGDVLVTCPQGTEKEAFDWSLDYNIPDQASAQTIAKLQVKLGGLTVGSQLIEREQKIAVVETETKAPEKEKKMAAVISAVSAVSIALIIGAVIFGSGTILGLKALHDERAARRRLKEKRAQRLRDMDISEEEFRSMVENRRKRKEIDLQNHDSVIK